jgi:hypothetical protein
MGNDDDDMDSDKEEEEEAVESDAGDDVAGFDKVGDTWGDESADSGGDDGADSGSESENSMVRLVPQERSELRCTSANNRRRRARVQTTPLSRASGA